MMDDLLQSLRVAARSLLRSPGFAAVAVLTLALGIGANTAIYSVVDGVLLRPPPLADFDRLVMVWETDRASGTTREPASVPDYLDFRQRSRRLAELGGFIPAEISLTPDEGGGDAERLAALAVSHELLPLLRLPPLRGRHFTADEDRPGGPRVALISEALWARRFARARDVVGRPLRLNDVTFTVVGVLPAAADFGLLQVLSAAAYGRSFADRGDRTRVDVWVPLAYDATPESRDTHPLFVLGRIAPGATVAQARRELSDIAAVLEREYPRMNDARGANVEPLRDVVFGPARPALLILLGAVALVLLVACVNVANLLLARGAARAHEITVRAALGAGPARLARQFLAESAVLTAAGAALGVFLAYLGLDALVALAPGDVPRLDAVRVDVRVLAATAAASALVALVFGVVPMLQVRAARLGSALRATGQASVGGGQHRLRSALVVAELALSVVLLASAGLLVRSLWKLRAVDPGFRTAGVLKAEFQLPQSRYPQRFADWPRWIEATRFADELRARALALPGVTAVSVAASHPLDAGYTSSISVVGREAEAGEWPEPAIRRIDAQYLAALGVPLAAGRAFAAGDDADGPPVALINAAARRRFFEGREPLGARIRLWGAERTVVGVIGDERTLGLEHAAPPAVYLPRGQAPIGGGSVLVRTAGDAASLVAPLRRIVRELDPALPLFGVEPLRDTVADSMGSRRFTMLLLVSFAALALVLAVVGVHGVLSYAVAQRRREIGVRVALGADARAVRALVLGQGMRLTALGLGIGLVGGLATSRLLAALLFGVGAADPPTFGAVALVLGGVALAATWLPARRASRVDPMAALRAE
jgi:predicted permease